MALFRQPRENKPHILLHRGDWWIQIHCVTWGPFRFLCDAWGQYWYQYGQHRR